MTWLYEHMVIPKFNKSEHVWQSILTAVCGYCGLRHPHFGCSVLSIFRQLKWETYADLTADGSRDPAALRQDLLRYNQDWMGDLAQDHWLVEGS